MPDLITIDTIRPGRGEGALSENSFLFRTCLRLAAGFRTHAHLERIRSDAAEEGGESEELCRPETYQLASAWDGMPPVLQAFKEKRKKNVDKAGIKPVQGMRAAVGHAGLRAVFLKVSEK